MRGLYQLVAFILGMFQMRGAPSNLCQDVQLKANLQVCHFRGCQGNNQGNNQNFSCRLGTSMCGWSFLKAQQTQTHTNNSVSWFVSTVQGVTPLCYVVFHWWPLVASPLVCAFQSSFVALKCQFEPLLHALTQTTIVTGNRHGANNSD